MSAPFEIPAELVRAQTTASDPSVSAWVSANAGSGKTYVLVQRVVRLLLDGVEPAKILCLTFTKAAAANMANRVFERLASWTSLDDEALDQALLKIEGRRPSPKRRLRARRLFAQALETPGGLKVQTIHAFCTGLLHQFPFEAGVAARFEVLEERAEAELIDQLRLGVLLQAAGAPDTPLGRALSTAIVAAADVTFSDVVRDAIGQRAALEGWIKRAGSVEAALAELAGALGVAPGDTVAGIEKEFLASPHLPAGEWPVIGAALAAGSATDRKHAERLAHATKGQAWENVESYLAIFCTAELEPRKNVVTKAIKDKNPGLFNRLVEEQERVCALLSQRRAALSHERTAALVTVADAVLSRYRAEKERRGLLDYDDLIEKTLALLSQDGSSAWVMYKLDLGIDHMLIDEAQDTSPQQWEVIRRLTAEFTAGAGARADVTRSIFAVGDEKQSIYSFQGAAPHRFDEMRGHYAREHLASGLAFEPVKLPYSFRSSPDVLGAVDEVFGRREAFAGLGTDPVPTVHEAVRRNAPGFVEIWPLFVPEERQKIEAWDAPFDVVSEQSPQVRLARRIATAVSDWIARGEQVGDADKRRPVTPGDILILVRQRGPLFEAVIRALKEERVEVAGADRLILTEHIAIMDMMSLADALLLPEDDLALAEVLKSPLFGFDDDDLFTFAYGRSGSLRAALREWAAKDARFAAAEAAIAALSIAARQQTPFAFYAHLLGAGGGRRKMLARLGLEAADALDEFLALALDYERRHTPSLQGFVAWLRASEAQVKRDMDIARDEVRVMTVHGAKGLEAPIVILADTTTKPAGPRDPRLLPLSGAAKFDESARPFVWAGAKADDVEPVKQARLASQSAAENEHRRLLYVAMTRAADRLIICGAHGARGMPPGCWYALAHAALAPGAEDVPAVGRDESSVLRWRKEAAVLGPSATHLGDVAPPPTLAVPAWLNVSLSPPPYRPAAVAPSRMFEREDSRGKAARDDRRTEGATARAKGLAIHRLLQSLPGVAAEHRAEVARRFLAKQLPALDADQIESAAAQVLGILAHPVFSPLFAEGTRAEVPIALRIARAGGHAETVAGQIDRLAVAPDGIFIADFKTDRVPARRPQDVPKAYRAQLALYRAALRRLYVDRPVRAALIFTETAELIELPPEMLDRTLADLGVTVA